MAVAGMLAVGGADARVVGIVFDDSRSLRPTFNTTLYAARLLIALLPPEDRAFIVRMKNPGSIEALPIATDKERRESLRALEDWEASATKTPVSSVTRILDRIARETRPGEEAALILLTDGEFDPDPQPQFFDELSVLRDRFQGRVMRVFFVAINPEEKPKSGGNKASTFREIIQRQGVARSLADQFGRTGRFDDTIEVRSGEALHSKLTEIVTTLLGGDFESRSPREFIPSGTSVGINLPFPIEGVGMVFPNAPGVPKLRSLGAAEIDPDKDRVSGIRVAMPKPDRPDWPQLASAVVQYMPAKPIPAGEHRLTFDGPLGSQALPVFHSRITPRWTLNIGDVQWSDSDGRLQAAAGQKAVLRVVLSEDAQGGGALPLDRLTEMPKIILRGKGQADREMTLEPSSGAFVTTLDFPARPGTEHYTQEYQIILRYPGLYQSNGGPLRADVSPPIVPGLRADAASGDLSPCSDCGETEVPIVYRSATAEPARLLIPLTLTPATYSGPVTWRLSNAPPDGVTIRLMADGRAPVVLDHRNGAMLGMRKAQGGRFTVEVAVAGADLTNALRLPELVASIPAAEKPVGLPLLAGRAIKIVTPPLVVTRANGQAITGSAPLLLAPHIVGSADAGSAAPELRIHGLLEEERLGGGNMVLKVSVFGLPAIQMSLSPAADGRILLVPDHDAVSQWWLFDWLRVLVALPPFESKLGHITYQSRKTGRSATVAINVDVLAPGISGLLWGLFLLVIELALVGWSGLWMLGSLAFGWWEASRLRFPKGAFLRVQHDRFGINAETHPLRQPLLHSLFSRRLFEPRPERYSDQYVTLEPISGGLRLIRRSDYSPSLRIDQSRVLIANRFRQDTSMDGIDLNWGTVLRDDDRNITMILSDEAP
ncbi:VWA domain-containing protein [Azospirillum cavernae]|uniref:VWA domain-containing protein n=1 Tax=Azospirillum cavernae TaxID=2320860 RepID=A0A418VN39_9PROT|nr:VWA domain-containing protein [Azospirillum cavernae]RJF77497.1 VWA domain-containing protein [Azospirillum cavernae]